MARLKPDEIDKLQPAATESGMSEAQKKIYEQMQKAEESNPPSSTF
jgi:cytochrome c556